MILSLKDNELHVNVDAHFTRCSDEAVVLEDSTNMPKNQDKADVKVELEFRSIPVNERSEIHTMGDNVRPTDLSRGIQM